MRRLAWLGLVVASLLAACESSKDPLLRGAGGKGGAGSVAGGTAGTVTARGGAGGSAGGTAGTGGTGRGGAGGAGVCDDTDVLCKRPFECIRTCGGPIEYRGCCPCEAPLFDNFADVACGGTTGSAGRGGAGGSGGGATGGAGTTGGRGGSSGTGGGAAGSGGTGGGGGGGGGTTGGGGTGGVRDCERFQCARPYECKRSCGGPIEYTGCCYCEPPLFDDFNGMVCSDGGGQPNTGYAGCTFIGGYNRVVVSKCDAASGVALNIILVQSTSSGMSTALSVPAGFALEYVSASASVNCPTRARLTGLTVSSISGSITWADLTSGGGPAHVNIDVALSVRVDNEVGVLNTTLKAQNVDVRPGCPN